MCELCPILGGFFIKYSLYHVKLKSSALSGRVSKVRDIQWHLRVAAAQTVMQKTWRTKMVRVDHCSYSFRCLFA